MNSGFESRRKRTGTTGAFNKNDLWSFTKYNVKSGNRKHAAFLSPVLMYRNLHYTGMGKMLICESDFIDAEGNPLVCEACKQPSTKYPDQLNFATEHLCALICIFEEKDQMRVSKKGKEYPVNWIQVLTLPTNKGGILTTRIEEAFNDGWIMDDIWKFEKNKEGTLLEPTPLSTRELKALGNQFDPEMHKALQKEYAAKEKGEAYSLILSAFAGVKYDNHELVTMGVKPLDNPDREVVVVGNDLDR